MKSLGRSSSSGLGNDGLDTEINGARNGDYVRGVKRRCFGIGDGATQERGRSFLETKWELEITRKRRELLPVTCIGFQLQGVILILFYR